MVKLDLDFGSIKNVGTTPVNNIVEDRNELGKYDSFTSFCERISDKSVNKKCIESLIKAGAFDEFNITRATMLASFETIVDAIANENKRGIDGQVTMFDISSDSEKENINKIKYTFDEHEEMSEKEILTVEKEMLGIYISGHPLEKYKEQIDRISNINTMDIKNILDNDQETTITDNKVQIMGNNRPKYTDGQNVIYAGIITSIKKKYTKNNKLMAFITVEDIYGQLEIMTFENTLLSDAPSIHEENVVVVNGRLSIKDDGAIIIANSIKDLVIEKVNTLIINLDTLTIDIKERLKGAIKYFNSNKNNTYIKVKINNELKRSGAIFLDENVLEVFTNIVGKDNLELKEE